MYLINLAIIFIILILLVFILKNKMNIDRYDDTVFPPFDDNYSNYEGLAKKPPGYHRYQSNLCDPTQDELPITFPDPDYDAPDIQFDKIQQIQYDLMYGSQPPCNQCDCD